MADYTFETMTPAQALAYNASTDTLHFTTVAVGASSCLLGFNPDGTITFATNVRSLLFGPGLLGEQQIYFPDGTRMAIGGPGDDLLIGPNTNDYIAGGPGNDTIDAGAGFDRQSGGPGADVFVVFGAESRVDTIVDFEPSDFLALNSIGGTPSNVLIFGLTDIDTATKEAKAAIESGQADFVAVQIGGGETIVWADYGNTNAASVEVALNNFQASSLTYRNFVPLPAIFGTPIAPLTAAATPTAPPPPVFLGAYAVASNVQGNMDAAVIPDVPGEVVTAGPNGFEIIGNGVTFDVFGHGLTYSASGDITGGVISTIRLILGPPFFEFQFTVDGWADRPSVTFDGDSLQTMFPAIFSANDNIMGSASPDLIRGFDGNDFLCGDGGGDTIYGGAGDDLIFADLAPTARGVAFSGPSYLRGEEGADYIQGGSSFDDINGNQGNDTASGGAGNDWVVGGKDHDLLFGDAGDDIVWGNLGNDTLDGGDGNDQVRGGQGDDSVSGGAGDDFVSGDRGNDTITGGAGADRFHGSQDAGIDRVLDFHASEGDRVMLDPGTTYTLSQVGADTVIDMGGGNQMILVGVQLSTLPSGWIFLG